MSRLPLEKNPNVFQIILSLNLGRKYQFEICEDVNLAHSSVGRFLKQLVENNYIRCSEGENRKKVTYYFDEVLFCKAYYKFVNFKLDSNKYVEKILKSYLGCISPMLERKEDQVYKLTIEDIFFGMTRILAHLNLFNDDKVVLSSYVDSYKGKISNDLLELSNLVSHLFSEGYYGRFENITFFQEGTVKGLVFEDYSPDKNYYAAEKLAESAISDIFSLINKNNKK